MTTGMIIASDVLRKMIERDKQGIEMIEKFSDIKIRGADVSVITSLGAFLKAIYDSHPTTQIKSVKQVMEVVNIMPAVPVDFKNNDIVNTELIKLAGSMTGQR